MGNFLFGLRNVIKLGTVTLPVLQGSMVSMPKNYNIPQVFSAQNLFQFEYVEGLQYPTFQINTQINSSWFTAAVLKGWFGLPYSGRTNDDVPTAGAIVYFNGVDGLSASDCKVNTLRIGATNGEVCRCVLVVMGYGTIDEAVVVQPSGLTKVTATPASFQHVSATGGLSTTKNAAGAFGSFDLTLNNNLDVNPELNYSVNPTDFNAGQFTAALRLVMQARATRLANGTDATISITPPSGSKVDFALLNALCQDPNERSVQFPRQMREYNYVLLGNDADSDPLTIS